MGKITIVKSLIIPRMIYKASILPLIIPTTFKTNINKLLFKFIWGSNWERVSRNVLCNNIETGGAKMMHLESYLTALHTKSLSLPLMKLIVHSGSLLKIYSLIVICCVQYFCLIPKSARKQFNDSTFKITDCVIYCTSKILQYF